MKPRCYNRPAFAESYTSGYGQEVRNTMSRDCGSWKTPPFTTPYPVLAGWSCAGCRWNPASSNDDDVQPISAVVQLRTPQTNSLGSRSLSKRTMLDLELFWCRLSGQW